MYIALKHIHVATVFISIGLFILRGFWMMFAPEMLRVRWVRIVPHANDTLLLVSGLTLTTVIGQYPFVHGWLTAKVLALLLYIALGMVALRYGRTKPVKIAAFLGGLVTVFYIYAVARAHHPLPWTAWSP